MLLHRRIVQALKAATMTKDKRMIGIRVEPSGECIATNRHLLLRAERGSLDPAEDFPRELAGAPEFDATRDFQGMIPLTALEGPINAAKGSKGKRGRESPIPVLANVAVSLNGDGQAYIVGTNLEQTLVGSCTPGDLTFFSTWRQVYDRTKRWACGEGENVPPQRALAVRLSVTALQDILDAAKAVGHRTEPTVRLYFREFTPLPVDANDYRREEYRDRVYTEVIYVELDTVDVPTMDGLLMPCLWC